MVWGGHPRPPLLKLAFLVIPLPCLTAKSNAAGEGARPTLTKRKNGRTDLLPFCFQTWAYLLTAVDGFL